MTPLLQGLVLVVGFWRIAPREVCVDAPEEDDSAWGPATPRWASLIDHSPLERSTRPSHLVSGKPVWIEEREAPVVPLERYESLVALMMREQSKLQDAEAEWKLYPPVDKQIYCPACTKQHLDIGEFLTRVHRTHRCETTPEGPGTGCGHEWRPFAYPTRGVGPLGVGMLPIPIVEAVATAKQSAALARVVDSLRGGQIEMALQKMRQDAERLSSAGAVTPGIAACIQGLVGATELFVGATRDLLREQGHLAPEAPPPPEDDRPWFCAGYADSEQWSGPHATRKDALVEVFGKNGLSEAYLDRGVRVTAAQAIQFFSMEFVHEIAERVDEYLYENLASGEESLVSFEPEDEALQALEEWAGKFMQLSPWWQMSGAREHVTYEAAMAELGLAPPSPPAGDPGEPPTNG